MSFEEKLHQFFLHGGLPTWRTPPAHNHPDLGLHHTPPPAPHHSFSKIKKEKSERGLYFFLGGGSLGTYLHCVIVNAVGRQRLHDAHVAGKRDRDTHEGGYLAELEPLRVCA